MKNAFIQQFEEKQMERKLIPSFRPGDTLSVRAWSIDDPKRRVQTFQGEVIALKRKGISSSFTLRRVGANACYMEKLFPTYSPLIESIKVVRRGLVRRAKLYYLREKSGKAARIPEKIISHKKPAAIHSAESND